MGWRTHVPNYNQTEIIDNLIRLMQGDPVLPMRLWYKGFRGTIERIPSNMWEPCLKLEISGQPYDTRQYFLRISKIQTS